MSKYIPKEIESKWQKKWQDAKVNEVSLRDAAGKKKFYLLVEFTYPSGDLHMGHWFAFAVPDILARLKKMQGFTVFAPNGFDAFGLPAENAAIKRGVHPKDWTFGNIEKMKQQFATMGALYDWEHQVITCEPGYYKWNQWIFLKMLEKGLAYRGKALANWCSVDQCVLANENVESGKCWRCGSEVVQKEVEQWFLKITDYAEKLLWPEDSSQLAVNSSQKGKDPVNREPITDNLIDWPQAVREGQNNWIGKSEGIEIEFEVMGPAGLHPTPTSSLSESRIDSKNQSSYAAGARAGTPRPSPTTITVFTKFPETIFGVTFLVVSPENPMVTSLTTAENKKQVEDYIAKASKKSELERKESREKTGTFTGSYVTNPVNGKKIPVWVADYVIGSYGTGAVMGVPGSDVRDFEFAREFGFEVIKVIAGMKGDTSSIKDINGVLEEGFIVNSGEFDGLEAPDPAKGKFMDFLEEKGWGKRKTNYHLHDWSISRQRYWGTPIPIIYCDGCGMVPVPERDLPIELPYEVDYAPKGKPPLATAQDWVNVKCPKCGKAAKREVETMDTFVDSSWYFLRYLDPKNEKEIAGKKVLADWMPVDIYFGGSEHTLGHTLYSRFFVKFLKDIGVLDFSEYAKKRVHHGVILGPDGSRMSKSKGNVVNPDDQVREYGADAVRMYLAFLGPYDLVAPWVPSGLGGVYHFLERVWALQDQVAGPAQKNSKFKIQNSKLSQEDLEFMHKTIKKVGNDIESIKFNTAVAALMEWLNHLSKKAHEGGISVEEYKTMLLLLAPFAPHMTEEIWQAVHSSQLTVDGQSKKKKSMNREPITDNWSIHSQPWPEYDEKLAKASMVTIVIQVNGKVREKLLVEAGTSQSAVEKLALESDKVIKFLGNAKPQKVIFVPDRLINLVV